jgi:hypothetical protein
VSKLEHGKPFYVVGSSLILPAFPALAEPRFFFKGGLRPLNKERLNLAAQLLSLIILCFDKLIPHGNQILV